MPHLAPLFWPAAFTCFWLIFLTLYTMVWWIQLPHFPQIFFHTPQAQTISWPWK